MPVAAIVARLTPAALARVEQLSGVMHVEPYHAALKLEPSIGRTPLRDPIKAVSEIYALELLLFPGENAELVAGAAARLGANVTAIWQDRVILEIHRSMLPQLAAMEPVKLVYEHLQMSPRGEETTTAMQTGEWNQSEARRVGKACRPRRWPHQ